MYSLIKILLFCLSLWSVNSLYAVDYTADLATVAALGTDAGMLAAPAIYSDDGTPGTSTTISPGDLKTIYFDALDYLGNPTRVYAWVGIPASASTGSPVPGIVLVHGGGGTAYKEWVEKWTERGYAAISIAVEGQTDVSNSGWVQHAMPGPARGSLYNDAPSSLTDQWMYHAVADCVLANSLLRSLPEVDATQVGLSGFSWGGVITSTVIGIDTRFKFAIPTYGCGHLFDSRNYYGDRLGSNESYKQIWDPMIRIGNATMPVLWFSWPEDPHFQMDSLAYTYHGAPGAGMVSLKPNMGHGGNWDSPESYDFADSVISTGAPWCVQQSLSLVGSTATVVFESTKTLNSASLVYTTGNDDLSKGIETNLVWVETALSAPVESPAGIWTVTATLPTQASGWFVNVKATGSDTGDLYGYTHSNQPEPDVTVSSDYQEVIDLSPTSGLAIEHSLANNQTISTVGLAYTGPANVEISSISVSGESHLGSFSCLTSAPLVLLTPTPDTTPVTIQFDNTVAGLTDGQTATATLTIVWDELDGSTDQIALTLSATATTAVSVIHDTSGDWATQNVNDLDHVIIRNDATVSVGESVDPNLIVNGSFEVLDVSTGGLSSVSAGNTSLTGWVVSDAGLYVMDNWVVTSAPNQTTLASDGDQFVQLEKGTAGTISQSFATTLGTTYELTFDYSALDFNSRSFTLNYDVGGANQTVSITSVANQVPWQTQTFQFTATAATTTLTFTGQGIGAGLWGTSIDNVSVVEVLSNLIVNGSFETPDIATGGFSQLSAGNTSLTGWTIADAGQKSPTGGIVVVDHWDTNQGAEPNTSAPSADDQFIQLQHSSGDAGIVSQAFATEVGAQYQLEFDYSAFDFKARSSTITYGVGGADQTVTFTSEAGQTAWATESYQFTATATTTTLSIEGTHFSGFWGVSIDNVSVKMLSATSDIADRIIVNDDASPITATLDINQNYSLTATTSILLGTGTGAGFVNQSNGTVTTADLRINSSGTGDTSQYNLSGGSLEAASTIVNNAGELNFTGGSMQSDGTIAVNLGGTFSVNRSDTVTQATDFGGGGISGAGGVVQNGSGTLVLNVANTYTGGTTVNAGILDLVGQNRIDGALTVDGTGIVKLSGTSHNAAQNIDSITLQSGGTLTDNSQGSFVQSVNPLVTFNNGGTMTSEAGANGLGDYGNFLFTDGINVTGTGLATISANGISFNYGETITVADTVAGAGTDLLISSIVKNARVGTKTKAGVGTLTLTGVNTDTSSWAITGGVLEIGGAGQLESGNYAGSITNNGTFAYNSTADQVLSGVISGSGALTKNGSGTLELPGNNTYSGVTTIKEGTFKLSGHKKRNLNTSYTVDGSSAVLEAANIQVFSSFFSSYDEVLTATNGGTIKSTFVAIRIGDVTLHNGSSLTSDMSNGTYGGFYIGQLAGGVSPTVTVSGSGASQIDGAGDLAIVATVFDVADSTGNSNADLTISVAMHDMTNSIFTGNVSIPGAVTKTGSGTMVLSEINNYSGATTVNAGVLSLGDGTNSTNLADGADVTVATGAVLNLNYIGTDTIDGLFLGGAQVAAGSWGATGSGATNINDTFFTGSGTLTVGFSALFMESAAFSVNAEINAEINADETFDVWGNGTFANTFVDTLPSSNPDSDSLGNLLEFAFGTDPTVANDAPIGFGNGVIPGKPLPVLNSSAGPTMDLRAVFGRRKEWVAAGLTYTVQFSADLSEWVDSDEEPTLLESGSGDIDAVYIPYPLLIETEAGFEKAQFFRLSVSQD